jgi:hypothetical protein
LGFASFQAAVSPLNVSRRTVSIGQHVTKLFVKWSDRDTQQAADLNAGDLAASHEVVGGIPTDPKHFRDFIDGVTDGTTTP